MDSSRFFRTAKLADFGREAVPLLKQNDYNGAVSLMTLRVANVIAQDAGIQLTGARGSGSVEEQPPRRHIPAAWIAALVIHRDHCSGDSSAAQGACSGCCCSAASAGAAAVEAVAGWGGFGGGGGFGGFGGGGGGGFGGGGASGGW